MASERPSEIMGGRLSTDTSHSTAFGGEVQHEKLRQSLSGFCINYETDFLACHAKDYPGFLDRDIYLGGGAARIPGPPESSSMAISVVPMICLFAGWSWLRGHFLTISGPVAR